MTEKKFKTIIRVEAIKAAKAVIGRNGGDAMNLLTEAKIYFEWLYNGKDPVIAYPE